MKRTITILAVLLMGFMATSQFVTRANENSQTGVSYTDDPPKWVQYYHPGPKLVYDEIYVELGVTLQPDEKPGLGIKIHAGLELALCCKYNGNPYSWCNTDLQDKRC